MVYTNLPLFGNQIGYKVVYTNQPHLAKSNQYIRMDNNRWFIQTYLSLEITLVTKWATRLTKWFKQTNLI